MLMPIRPTPSGHLTLRRLLVPLRDQVDALRPLGKPGVGERVNHQLRGESSHRLRIPHITGRGADLYLSLDLDLEREHR